MERPNIMDERNNKRKSSEISEHQAGPKYFVYTSETKDADIPKETLTHLRVDSSVSEIPKAAFRGRKALVHVQLPETLARIEESAFDECSNLKCVQFVSGNDSLDASSFNPTLKKGTMVFPERAKLQIDPYAFGHCLSLRNVIICSVSTKLGFAAFCGCSGLKSVELPEGLQEIQRHLFEGCESLTTVKIPSSVIKIGESAFSGCRRLTSFDLPHGILHIGDGSFENCDSIYTLHIPLTVSSIGKRSFMDCLWLWCVELPATLEIIDAYAFYRCHGLESIDLPSTLKEIGSHAFADCSSLSHIRIPPSVDVVEHDTFIGCPNLISIEHPEGSMPFIDLFECYRLVNIAGASPNAAPSPSVGECFMYLSKLGSVVDGHADLVRSLQHRFDDSPLNKLCYYHSYLSPDDAMMQLQSLMEDDPLAATTEVDALGLTPLHTLSLSQTPNVDMLLAMMKGDHLDHFFRMLDPLCSRDSKGSTPMDYLCLSGRPDSSEVIRTVLMTRFDCLLGSAGPWKSDMENAIENALNASTGNLRRCGIRSIYYKLASYEWKEIFSNLELFLWKIRIEGDVGSEEEHIVDRESCRINCGAAVVIPHVLSFLGRFDGEHIISYIRK
eukprot:scaffold1436_cov112-Cylindrotheca_fusiformis.AAC.5